MSPQAEKDTESAPDEYSPLLDAVRKVLLAGIGAVMIASAVIIVVKAIRNGQEVSEGKS